ncbi:MAG: hypothetical protein NC123_05665 [Butyrivibrio sp.]|nr:hypothetical protein [Butyrivibrio sp.]
MQKINYKKHIAIFLSLAAAFLLGCAALVVLVDPFFQYHKPLDGISYTIDNQLSQNPGLAKKFDYDSIILGSSMTVNFDTNLFREIMGLNTLKLSYNGAYPKDIHNIMTVVQNSHDPLKEVFLGIDISTYKAAPGIVAYGIPEYLYDDSPWNDAAYLLNKDVLLNYILKGFFTKQGSTPINEIYSTWKDIPTGRQRVLAAYSIPERFLEPLPEDTYISNIEESMSTYIIPYIESMPETRFTVFFPPYSILYWYTRSAEGSLEAEIAGEKRIMEMLLSHPNVSVYYFQNLYDFITDLDQYSDYTHYTHEMNDYMTRCFADGTCQLTVENYEQVLNEMLSRLQECDFVSYLSPGDSDG